MARDLHASVQSEVVKKVVTPVYFIEIDYAPDPIRVWTGPYSISWDSKTWDGGAGVLDISSVGESYSGVPQAVDVTLNGLDASILADVMAADIQSSNATIWLAFMDSANAVISNPVKLFFGFPDVPTITEGDSLSVSVRLEPYSSMMRRSSERRWTPDDHKIEKSTDKFFDYVPQMPSIKILWGRTGANGPDAPRTPNQYMPAWNFRWF